jgi:protein-disulfide isomerase
MKSRHFLTAAAAVFATAACNGDGGSGGTGGTSAAETTVTEAVKPPANGDWSTVVTPTNSGGFLMGNPNAKVQLVEFASMTCPHCAEFQEAGARPLIEQYVKSGQVGFELRNYVRDPLDMTMSMIARCGGKERFFPLTDAMFESQNEFFQKVQGTPPEQQQALAQLPPAEQLTSYAKLAGLQQWAAMRGVPSAKQQQCLSSQAEMDRLVQMNTDATSTFNVPGTPAFVINGKLVEGAADWKTLEPKIKEALS